MNHLDLTEENWVHAIDAADEPGWDIPIDLRHDPRAAFAATKRAHRNPIWAEPNTEPKPRGERPFPQVLALTANGPSAGIRFRSIDVRTGIGSAKLPAEEYMAGQENSFRKQWNASLKWVEARLRQASAKLKASAKRTARGNCEAERTLLVYEQLRLPARDRAAWLAAKYHVSAACIRNRITKARSNREKESH